MLLQGKTTLSTSNIILGLRQIDVPGGRGGNNKKIWSQTHFHAKLKKKQGVYNSKGGQERRKKVVEQKKK